MTVRPNHEAGEAERRVVEAYAAAQLSDASGYSSATHSFMREDVILHMYEILMLLRQAFLGLRWRPIDRWNIDAIYGSNITGSNGNWFTVATVLRFPAKAE